MNRRTCSLLATLSFAASVAPLGLRADVTPGLVAPSLRPGASTTTLAGTGRAGNDDGPGDRATFMLPTVVRYAADGTLYVVDTAGQRIRAISPAGVVTTVAGGGEPTPDGLAVAGGYRDGPAASARFDDPTGLALGPDGALYVADTDNHCIRKIAGGMVTTFLGRRDVPGKQDGPAAKVTFTAPMGLAFDRSGTLWVADNGVGIRKILAGGRTFTLSLPVSFHNRFTDVAVYEAPNVRRLFIAAELGVLSYDLRRRVLSAIPGVYEGSTAVHPYALVPLAEDELLSADPGWNVVRYLRLARPPAMVYDFSRVVAGGPLARPDLNGGYREAEPGNALFAAPTGIAIAPSGDITVADAGNRRIRSVPAIDRRHAIAEPLPQTIDHDYYTIAYIGNSYAFWNGMWDDSIPGTIERRLNAERATLGITRPIRVIAARFDGSGITAKLQFIREVLADSGPDMVVWSFNGFDLGAEQQAQLAKKLSIEQTGDYLATTLTDLKKYLAARKIAFFAGAQPIGIGFSPTEASFSKLSYSSWRPFDQTGVYIETLIEKAIKGSGVPSVLSLAAFDEYEKGARPLPLYESLEGSYHFTPAGDAFYADLLLRGLEAQKPWAQLPAR